MLKTPERDTIELFATLGGGTSDAKPKATAGQRYLRVRQDISPPMAGTD
jgi:hypothetical protein